MFSAIHNENNDQLMRAPTEHSMVTLNDLKEEEQGPKNNTAASWTIMAESRMSRTHDRSTVPYIHPSLKCLNASLQEEKRMGWGTGEVPNFLNKGSQSSQKEASESVLFL